MNSWQVKEINLYEKLGFQREGTHRRMLYTQGRFVDVLWFGLTAEEFHETNV
jgi:RimJ/RimL family protein N-acetyltransferase